MTVSKDVHTKVCVHVHDGHAEAATRQLSGFQAVRHLVYVMSNMEKMPRSSRVHFAVTSARACQKQRR